MIPAVRDTLYQLTSTVVSTQKQSFIWVSLITAGSLDMDVYNRDGVIVICNHDYLSSITFFSNHKVICNREFL